MATGTTPWPNRLTTQANPTSYDTWLLSDAYHNERLIKPDPALDNVNNVAVENGLPLISVSTAQGKLLNLIVKSIRAKKIVEVGTLAGYSAIWMAKALPADGKIVTFELEEKHAKVAQSNFEVAGLADKIQVIVGPASENMPKLTEDGTFDLAFIDADKKGNTDYFKNAKRLVRSGGVIIVDNVVRNGRVGIPAVSDESVEGVRTLLEYLRNDPEVEATTIATVGEKGYDGFLYAVKN